MPSFWISSYTTSCVLWLNIPGHSMGSWGIHATLYEVWVFGLDGCIGRIIPEHGHGRVDVIDMILGCILWSAPYIRSPIINFSMHILNQLIMCFNYLK